jgi:hypothetical protein
MLDDAGGRSLKIPLGSRCRLSAWDDMVGRDMLENPSEDGQFPIKPAHLTAHRIEKSLTRVRAPIGVDFPACPDQTAW